MSLFVELGLGAAFTLIALAPMVPDWMKHNDGPTVSVKFLAGIPDLKPEENRDQKQQQDAYNRLSYGGSIPTVSLFNVNGNRLAYYRNEGGKEQLTQGSTVEVHASYLQKANNEKPEYITVTASGIDAVCLAALIVTHPTSSDTYAFLPGEVGKVCSDFEDDTGNFYPWGYSAASVQFKGPEGNTAMARPKCLWIDSPDENKKVSTSWKGFQVHLPDFKLDNSTFKKWEGEPYQMCGSRARFGTYHVINEYMCPPVFESAPAYGARIPMPEYSTCVPGLMPDENGVFEENPCKDSRLSEREGKDLMALFGQQCDQETTWKPGGRKRAAKERRLLQSRQEQSGLDVRKIQSRFTGKLVKSRDPGQSASELCNSRSSIGPNFYSYHEKRFCDMQKRKLYPRCETLDETECFDTLYNETRHANEKRGEKVTHFSVQDWL